jgi:hypothetical protein
MQQKQTEAANRISSLACNLEICHSEQIDEKAFKTKATCSGRYGIQFVQQNRSTEQNKQGVRCIDLIIELRSNEPTKRKNRQLLRCDHGNQIDIYSTCVGDTCGRNILSHQQRSTQEKNDKMAQPSEFEDRIPLDTEYTNWLVAQAWF